MTAIPRLDPGAARARDLISGYGTMLGAEHDLRTLISAGRSGTVACAGLRPLLDGHLRQVEKVMQLLDRTLAKLPKPGRFRNCVPAIRAVRGGAHPPGPLTLAGELLDQQRRLLHGFEALAFVRGRRGKHEELLLEAVQSHETMAIELVDLIHGNGELPPLEAKREPETTAVAAPWWQRLGRRLRGLFSPAAGSA
jgi:hypothetical protein